MPSAASLEVIPSDATFITFPVTDGDSSRRPDNMKPPPLSAREVNWHRTMTMEEKYSSRWRNLIGQGIAKLLGKPGQEKYCLQRFPEGYWMFDHNKGPISNIRHDLYLYGSKSVLRFRSPAEFIPHGYWLLTDPTLNNNNCGCKYCGGSGGKSQTEISQTLGLPTGRGATAVTGSTRMRIGVQRPSKHTNNSGSGTIAADTPWHPKELRRDDKMHPGWRTSSLGLRLAADITMISDLRSSRRFRVGELVWCVWEKVTRNISLGKEIVPVSHFWPAIVLDCSLRAMVNHLNSGYGSYTVSHQRLYSVVRLGATLEVQWEFTLGEEYILPWHAYHVDPALWRLSKTQNNPLRDSFVLALHTAKQLVKVWAACGRLPIKVPAPTPTPPGAPSRVWSNDSVPLDGQVAPLRSTPPLLPFDIDTGPPQRSPVRLAPPSPVKRVKMSVGNSNGRPFGPSVDSHTAPGPSRLRTLRPPQAKSFNIETRYEGLWYGAERLWTGDVVRLCPERDAFAASLSLSHKASGDALWEDGMKPSPGAAARGVLMRVNRIFARIGSAGLKECAIAGPLYELAPEGWATESSMSAPAPVPSNAASVSIEANYPWDVRCTPPPTHKESNSGAALHPAPFPLPPAPPGYALRPLLPPGLEIPLPASFIAGRYYPDILKWPLLSPLSHTILVDLSSFSLVEAADREGVHILSLCALAPGRFNQAVCADVRLGKRTRMLEEAIRLAQDEFCVAKDCDDNKMAVDGGP